MGEVERTHGKFKQSMRLVSEVCPKTKIDEILTFSILQKTGYAMVGGILNHGGERLRNPSTSRAINDYDNSFEGD